MTPVLFYKTRGPHGCFSNFSRHEVNVFGRVWKTSEHAFQAMKFFPHRPDLVAKVGAASLPSDAAAIGRDRSLPLSPQWEAPIAKSADLPIYHTFVDDGVSPGEVATLYKDAVMLVVVLAKFQNAECGRVLIETGTSPIIEDTSTSGDSYWGWGRDQKGKNKLGKVLMTARTVLQEAPSLIPTICRSLQLTTE